MQLQQHRVQSPQRQMADALVVVQSLANALGRCQFVIDTQETMSTHPVTLPSFYYDFMANHFMVPSLHGPITSW